jgi:hypothetical protein
MKNEPVQKTIIGGLEICDLPDLNIADLEVRVDTGAKTSSLHVDNICCIKVKGKPWVEFDIHPDIHNVKRIVKARSPLVDIRLVKSSSGESDQRYVIRTPIRLGNKTWPIEITLANRSNMSYLMLLGREAMGDRFLVDPSQRFLANES